MASVGIFIRNSTLHIAVLKGPRRRPKVVHLERMRITTGVASRLSEFFDKNNLPRGGVTLALPAKSAVVRKVTLPLTNIQQIRQTIKYQVEKYLPGVNPDDAVVDFFVTNRTVGQTELLLVIMKKDELKGYLSLLGDARIEPEKVTFDFACVFNLLDAAGAAGKPGRTAMIDFSKDAVRLFLAADGKFVLVRNLPPSAEGSGPGGQGDVLRRLKRELDQSRMAAGWDESPGKIVLTGVVPSALSPVTLGKTLGADVEVLDVATGFSLTPDAGEMFPSAHAALGAAMAGFGREKVELNLLRGEFVYRSPYQILRRPLLFAAAALVLLLTALLLVTMHRASSARLLRANIKKESKKLHLLVFPANRPKFTATFHETIKNRVITGRKKNKGARLKWPSFLVFMRKLSESMPRDRRNVVTSITFNGFSATLWGFSENDRAFDEMKKALTSSGHFNVRAPYRAQRHRGKRRVKINIELTPRGD